MAAAVAAAAKRGASRGATSAAAVAGGGGRRRSSRVMKKEETPPAAVEEKIKKEADEDEAWDGNGNGKKTKRGREMSSSSSAAAGSTPLSKSKRIKTEKVGKDSPPSHHAKKKSSSSSSPSKASKKDSSSALLLQTAKLQKYTQFSTTSPYPPTFTRPTPSECHQALSILTSIHGPRQRPSSLKASSVRAGCGDSPSVLDALVRTILSQNTSDRNSSAAKRSMDSVYGSSDNWAAIASGGQAKLASAIQCGGLAQIKSRVILTILEQVQAQYGSYSLDHLHAAATEDAFTTLLSFQGVGPKTASCVVLFCLGRDSFAVDTHVFRISKLLGWVPKTETDRERAQAHLETKVPPEDKYALHVLMVTHGKVCPECRAGGKVVGKGEERCKLREAFGKKGGVKDEMESDGDE